MALKRVMNINIMLCSIKNAVYIRFRGFDNAAMEIMPQHDVSGMVEAVVCSVATCLQRYRFSFKGPRQ